MLWTLPPPTPSASKNASSLIIRVGYPPEADLNSNVDSGMLLSRLRELL
jgi:hypothetical protein